VMHKTLVDKTYAKKELWWKLSIRAAASTGKFTSDRSIKEYAEKIWNLPSCERPIPDDVLQVTNNKSDSKKPLRRGPA